MPSKLFSLPPQTVVRKVLVLNNGADDSELLARFYYGPNVDIATVDTCELAHAQGPDVTEIFVADTPSPEQLVSLLRAIQGLPVILNLPAKTFGIMTNRMSGYFTTSSGRLRLRGRRPYLLMQHMLWRLTNQFAALLGLAALAPLFLVIAILIRLDSPGPVFFTQTRAGKDGKPFTILKFRTMRVDTRNDVHEELARQYISGVPITVNNATYKPPERSEVTRVGRWLRRTSLDELPQLINVLLGSMQLVGPRPVPIYELKYYKPWHWHRLRAMPGITGVWQVYGRSQVDFTSQALMDIYYYESWSIWKDIVLIMKTIPAVIRGTGAY